MTAMTPLQRVLATLGHREPDRVPFFLLVTMHGAKELGLSIKDYFARAENVVEGQLRMRRKYGHDCLNTFFYAALEMEAFGGEVIYREDGPPNAGAPIIRTASDIQNLQLPPVEEVACLRKVLDATRALKAQVGDDVPIIGVAMSPFSLPVMQMGFASYIELIYEQPELFDRLMKVNERFCVAWANAQLLAGATAICYFDPVSSPSIVPVDLYRKTGFQIAQRTIAAVRGPVGVHLASGRCLAIASDLAQTGAALIGVSALEDLRQIKEACQGKLAILGNLNGVEMRRWSPAQTEEIVRDAIAKAARGGGYILSDNHGEIPWQVPEEVLLQVGEAVRKWGNYPLEWLD